ncbi:hypothetical protein ACS0TY_017682 [Phlomoides rotata]
MQRGNGTSACASCKHQRKKCTESCTLAPFFPVEKGREFQAVQKVFGVSNITKIITRLNEDDRKVAVDSLVWEALCRERDPVLGPYGDYRRVCEELRLYKSQCQQFLQNPIHGGIVYKASTQGLMGWGNSKVLNNNNNDNNNNISTNNFHGNGKSVVDFRTFGYFQNHHILHQDTETLRAERENGSAVILPQQQYFIAGQYNPLDSKSVESTLWEGSS